MTMHLDWLRPRWSGGEFPGLGAVMTTRVGGVSAGPYAGLNLRQGVGDDPAAVAINQARFADAIGATPVWLDQVHGTRVLRLTSADAGIGVGARAGDGTDAGGRPGTEAPALPPADASVTTVPGVACAVQVADCLPVLFAAPGARAVGAAHAGWRGLAAGVLEATLAGVCDAASCRPEEVSAWLGACIGPGRFEVGADVLRAFGVALAPGTASTAGIAGTEGTAGAVGAVGPVGTAGSPAAASMAEGHRGFRPHAPGKWLADLPLLARDRLRAAGVGDISGGGWCTVDESSRFFSFRRERVTGRMAAAIWIEPRR